MITYKLDNGLILEQDNKSVSVKNGDKLVGFINGVIREEMGFYRIYINILGTDLCTAVFTKGGE